MKNRATHTCFLKAMLAACCILHIPLFSQDIHFSNWQMSPLNLNPAQTGLFEGDGRLIFNYRTQWRSVQVPYNTFSFGGDFNLTQQWKIAVTSGYNFSEKQLQVTSIDIYRDLHCWEMRLGAVPFGPRKNYNFTLNVKASVLQDLKLLRRRDFRDAL